MASSKEVMGNREEEIMVALGGVLEEMIEKLGDMTDFYALEGEGKYRERFRLVPLKESEKGLVATKDFKYSNKPCYFLYEVIHEEVKDTLRVRTSLSFNSEFRMMCPWAFVSFAEASEKLEEQTKLLTSKMKAELIELSCLY